MDNIVVKLGGINSDKLLISLDALGTKLAAKSIEELYIYNESDPQRVKSIIRKISQVVTKDSPLDVLVFFDTFNKLGDEAVCSIATELPRYTSLSSIGVFGKYGNKGAIALCNAVAGMARVSSVDMYAPFTDAGVEAVISLIQKKPNLTHVGIQAATIGLKVYQQLFLVLRANTSIKWFCFPRGSAAFTTIPRAMIEECFRANTSLTKMKGSAEIAEPVQPLVTLNLVCEEMGVGKEVRATVPKYLTEEDEIRNFLKTKLGKVLGKPSGKETDPESAEKATEAKKRDEDARETEIRKNEAREKEAREKEAREKEAREREAREREAREREASEKETREKEARENEAWEKEAREKEAREKAQEKQARDNEAREKAAREKEAREKEAREKAYERVVMKNSKEDEEIVPRHPEDQNLITWHNSVSERHGEIVRLHRQMALASMDQQVQLAKLAGAYEEHSVQYAGSIKQRTAKYLVSKAGQLKDETNPSEVLCLLQLAREVDAAVEEDIAVKMQLEEKEKAIEAEYQRQMEAKIISVKEKTRNEVQQEISKRTEGAKGAIQNQKAVLTEQENQLQEQQKQYAGNQKAISEREILLQKQQVVLSEQVRNLGALVVETAAQSTTTVDTSALMQQLALSTGDVFFSAKEIHKKLRALGQHKYNEMDNLRKQLDIYYRQSMRQYLKRVKRLASIRHQISNTPFPLKCFISYAWETNSNDNKVLQNRLQRLKDELEVAGMEVLLDIRNMQGSMKEFMLQGIDKADKVLLICTPRLKVRAADTAFNNLKLELETAVEKAKTTSDSKFIVPLLFSGSFYDSMPPQVGHLLSINLCSQVDYYGGLAAIAPLGLIPMLLGLENDKEYREIHDRLFDELGDYIQWLK